MTDATQASDAWTPLEGLRVLEVSHSLVGAYAGKLFREYGAETVLVEDPSRESEARRYGPFYAADGGPSDAGLHRYLNAGKRGIAVDDGHPDGGPLLARLAAAADLVIHEFTASEAESRGLTYAQLSGARPSLVVLAITPFGGYGPRSGWSATEEILFALSGRMALQGEPQRQPLAYAPVIISAQIATTAAGVAIAAVNRAEATGAGCDIDVSGLEAQLASVDNLFLMWTLGGYEPPRGLYPPYTYPCADSYILLGAVGPRYIAGIATALGQPEIVNDVRFNTPMALAEHQLEFDELVIPFFLQHSAEELLAMLQATGVMCAPLQSPADALRNPQYHSRDFFQRLDCESEVIVPGPSFRLEAGAPPPTPAAAPRIGQHTESVLTDWLGLSTAELQTLRRIGAVR